MGCLAVAETILNKEIQISKIDKINNSLKQSFSQIYAEFEDHLTAINENTSEIQENYSYTCEIDQKISKLNERIDEIHDILTNLTGKKTRKMPKFEDIDPLTSKEKTIFLNIYTEHKPITYAQLATKLSIPISLARQHVTNLLEKGIPIQKVFHKTRPYIYLDPKFKNIQAKKNILKIEQKILV
jgi:ribosomal protein S25